MEPFRVIWAGEREAHVIIPDGRPAGWYRALMAAGIAGVAELTPGSRSVQIRVRDDADPEGTLALVRSALQEWAHDTPDRSVRLVEIPICSDAELAPDLDAVARNAGLSPDEASDLHASGEYTVGFLGFSPGFPYLDGLPGPLHTARLESPRVRVRAGSVGIAGAQTGVYPQPTPGGWRLIGATPLKLFDPTRDKATLLAPGDRVRFRRIARGEFDAIELGEA